MAGFAINVQLLFKYPYATMPYKAGFEEDRFLSALAIQLDEIEPKAENCTRVCTHGTWTLLSTTNFLTEKAKIPYHNFTELHYDSYRYYNLGSHEFFFNSY